MMKTWHIWYHYWYNDEIKEKAVYIKADSYDEALAEARKLNSRYSAGQVVKEVLR